MPTALDKFILQLASKAGIAPTDQRLVDLLAHTELGRINVGDELVTAVERSLITVTDAKNNHPDIKSHYFAEIMSNVDRVLDGVYRDYEFSDDDKAAFNAERSSTKRIGLVIAKLKEKGDAALAAAGNKKDPNTQQHLQTINDLNAQLAGLRTQLQQASDSHQAELRNIKIDTQLTGRLGSVKTVFDTLPADVKLASIKTILQKEIQDNGIKLVLDENGSLKLLRNDDSNYFDENNRLVTLDDFISKSLAKNKVLPQNNAAPPAGGEPPKGQNNEFVDGKPKGGNTYPSMKSLIEEAEQSLTNVNPMATIVPAAGA